MPQFRSSREFFSVFGDKSCVATSISISTGIIQEVVLEALMKLNLKKKMNRGGLAFGETMKVLKELNVNYTDVSQNFKKWRDRHNQYGMNLQHFSIGEQEFKRQCDPKKRYIVMNRNHAWCMIEGVYHDPNFRNNQKGRRLITRILEINA
jgi:hypothetical protein